MHLGHKWLALILGSIVWSDRWCTNQTTCNYRKWHRLRPLNLIWCRVMCHLTTIPWLSSIMFRAFPTSRNRSRRHNCGTKTELECVTVYIFITATKRVLYKISDYAPIVFNPHTRYSAEQRFYFKNYFRNILRQLIVLRWKLDSILSFHAGNPCRTKYFAARCEIEISSALRKLRR